MAGFSSRWLSSSSSRASVSSISGGMRYRSSALAWQHWNTPYGEDQMLAPTPVGSLPTPTFEPPVPLSIAALLRLLGQLRDVILRVDDETYVTPPAGRPSGSIGAHVRHCLDHVAAFLEGTRTGSMSYDRRQRGTAVEAER